MTEPWLLFQSATECSQSIAELPRGVLILASGALGFVGAIVSSFGLYGWRQRKRRASTREAFREELKIPGDAISELADQSPGTDLELQHREVPTTLYEQQQHRIDLLSPEEVRRLIAYYSTAQVVRSKLDQDPLPEELFDEQLDTLEQNRQSALKALGD